MSAEFLHGLFSVCFWFGTAATVFGFVFGLGRHGPLHLSHDGHSLHFGNGASAHGVSPFNLTSILAFLVVFGAVGLAFQNGVGGVIALLLAVVAGLVAGGVAFLFIARLLLKGETILVDEPMVGVVGTVSIPIGEGHVGEIIYTRNGVRRSDGARSSDGRAIDNGKEVVIVSYENGIATVQPWEQFLLESQKPPIEGHSGGATA